MRPGTALPLCISVNPLCFPVKFIFITQSFTERNYPN
jgi:hypothetical protein